MAWHRIGAEYLHEPVVTNYQLGYQELPLVLFESKFQDFLPRKCIWNWRIQYVYVDHFVQGSVC